MFDMRTHRQGGIASRSMSRRDLSISARWLGGVHGCHSKCVQFVERRRAFPETDHNRAMAS